MQHRLSRHGPVAASEGAAVAARPIGARLARVVAVLAAALIGPAAPVQPPSPASAPASASATGSAGPIAIGMNLAGLSNFTPELPFIDYMKAAGDPATGQLSVPVAVGPVDLVMLYDGSTAVSVYDAKAATSNAIGYNAMQPTRYAPGRILFHSDGGGSVNFKIEHLDPANPMRNIRLMRVKDEAAYKAGEIINPDFAAFIKTFSPLRTMDWSCTNGASITSWANRPKLTDVAWGCVPIEAQIALANKVKSSLWLNVPAHADDEYIRQLVTMVRDTLDPALKLHLEYSNEVWNQAFEQSKFAQAQADKLWGKGQIVPWGNEMWAGYRGAQMSAIAREVFGADADKRLAVVYSTFPHWVAADADDAFDKGVSLAGKGTIRQLFRDYATTTYFGGEFGIPGGAIADQQVVLTWVLGGPAGLDKAFQQLEHGGLLTANGSLDFLKGQYPREAARARAKSLDLVAYEGGLHISFFGTDHPAEFTDFVKRMVADPRMKGLYARMVRDFAAAGGREITPFNDVGGVGLFGAWGTVDRLGGTSPRLEALRELSTR